MKIFVTIIVPIISAICGYISGVYHERFKEKRSKLNLTFSNLYSPFEKLLLKKTHGAFIFSDLDKSLQIELYNILLDNYEFADSKLKRMITEFKWVYDEYITLNHPLLTPESDLNKVFWKLTVHISEQYDKLCSKLYYHKFKI